MAGYRCLIRKKIVAATPEEEVRQKLLHWLIQEKGFPEHLIDVEVSLNRFEKNNPWRVDVLISQFSSESAVPEFLCLAECKRSGEINAEVIHQLHRYANVVPAQFLLLTDGLELFVWEKQAEKYRQVENLQNFADFSA